VKLLVETKCFAVLQAERKQTRLDDLVLCGLKRCFFSDHLENFKQFSVTNL
jgi:hypothetical protein